MRCVRWAGSVSCFRECSGHGPAENPDFPSSRIRRVSQPELRSASALRVAKLAKRRCICQLADFADTDGASMPTSSARTLKSPRRLARRRDRRTPSPQWQFLRGFFKNPVMVGSVIPSSRVVIEKMLRPVDWENTRLFVEYGPGVGTFTRPVLDLLGPDAKLVTIDTNPDFTKYLTKSIEDPRLIAVTGSAADVESILADHGLG